jgi:hypothetical protein
MCEECGEAPVQFVAYFNKPGGKHWRPPQRAASVAAPSPQSKSAVADFDHLNEWPKPAYTRFRLGEGRGGGSRGDGTNVRHSPTPTPDPSLHGGGEKRTPAFVCEETRTE